MNFYSNLYIRRYELKAKVDLDHLFDGFTLSCELDLVSVAQKLQLLHKSKVAAT